MGRRVKTIIKALAGLLLLQGCIGQQSASSSRSINNQVNSPTTVDPYQSYVMTINPVQRSGGANLDMNVSLGTYLDPIPQIITTQQVLKDTVTITNPSNNSDMNLENILIEVKQTQDSGYLTMTNGTWAYDANSDQFQEVNTFYLLKKEVRFFQEALWNQAIMSMNDSSMPALFSLNGAYWPYSYNQTTNTHTASTLSAYTKGMNERNAAFYPSEFVLRFGVDTSLSGLYLKSLNFTQDPSIVFHEVGHAMVHIMMNIRNLGNQNTVSTRLGYRFYDEAGAINEGLADFFSYALTGGHTHFADWVLGNFYHASRPICESDSLHTAGISENPSERLKYPDFLQYDPNDPGKLYEDIHQAGMIASHFLVALSKQLESSCGFSHETASKYIMGVLSETMAKLGDLKAQGIDGRVNDVNLNESNSLEWIQTVNPINYRSFFQTFSYKLLQLNNYFSTNGICSNITKDDIEQLLDMYGLLLFRSYNDDGNSTGVNTTTQVNILNQQQTTLISKEHITLDPTDGASIAYVFDQRESIANTIQSYIANGTLSPSTDLASSTLIPRDYSYNNQNGLISPGELVGISLNLYNNSSSPMAGVQVLANDWDHAKNGKACNTFENNIKDTWPTASEGAADTSTETGVAGDCTYISRANSETAPVCFLQLNDTNSTQWVSQERFRSERGLEPLKCLGGANDTEDCYIRAVNHLNTAYYSKIDSHKTWMQTMTSAGQDLQFHSSNLLFFEVNPWIPPGTKVNCRLRVRFTNCEDCYNRVKDGLYDNFDDYQYAGPEPFKIINFQFTVID